MPTAPKPFLTAAWRHLAMLNYTVDAELLQPYVPAGTELDHWGGEAYCSLVGFMFLDTRVLGVPVPFHRDFEEVNLRFYVKREHEGELRRGVVFIKELVPKPMVAALARLLYRENYEAVPMTHWIGEAPQGGRVEYAWEHGGRSHVLALRATEAPRELVPGSEMEFIAEHYWGYAKQRDGGTVEYRVEHPPWRAASAEVLDCDLDAEALYGPEFGLALAGKPCSAFIAEGSVISVSHGRRVPLVGAGG